MVEGIQNHPSFKNVHQSVLHPLVVANSAYIEIGVSACGLLVCTTGPLLNVAHLLLPLTRYAPPSQA